MTNISSLNNCVITEQTFQALCNAFFSLRLTHVETVESKKSQENADVCPVLEEFAEYTNVSFANNESQVQKLLQQVAFKVDKLSSSLRKKLQDEAVENFTILNSKKIQLSAPCLVQLSALFVNIRVIKCCKLKDDTLKELCRFPKLKELQVNNSLVSDRGLEYLKGCPLLERLVLKRSMLSRSAADRLFLEHPTLRWFNEIEFPKINDSELSASLQDPKIVTEVFIAGAHKLTDKALFTIAKRYPDLVELEIHGCFQFTDLGLKAIQTLGSLKRLELYGQKNFSSKEIANTKRMLPNTKLAISKELSRLSPFRKINRLDVIPCTAIN